MGLTIEQQKALALAKARVRAKAGAKKYEGFGAGADQFSSGLNEGIASFAGAPVDLATAVINGLVQRPQFTDTTDYANFDGKVTAAPAGMSPGIENPAGGSATMLGLMDPLISDTAPQTMAQRYLRRGGQELGFGIPAAMTGAALPGYGAAAREAVLPYMATSAAGDVGAAVGGQTSREIAPDNGMADFLASMIGGGGLAYATSRMTPELGPVQSLDDLKQSNADKWSTIRGSADTLTPEASARLSPELYAMLKEKRATNPNLFPRANATVDDITALPPKSLYEVEEARRLAGRNVASNADEAAVGVEMKKTIDQYLTGLKPEDVQGADPESAIALMQDARRGTHQAFKADEVLNKEMRAESRAATTGTGGNEVNATKQNIRAIFDRERDPTLRGKGGGYTPDEMAAMERAVMGSKGSNVARLFGRLSPNAGALPLMASGGGLATAAAGLATGNPLLTLAAAPSMFGMASKTAAESMTKKDIERLMKTILNGGKAPAKSAARAATEKALIQQFLTSPAGYPQ
jgi:hypothetical protein